ncbi:hypothetical protein MRB53_028447 [Persea americana]|uniref:Uncharacterized protein n=1 Tax=Persea americana TaxID=3435 RepID=A0ACC2KG70_PERAE|nr:hypothetical protein MRB53_028447 [Persea americana]
MPVTYFANYIEVGFAEVKRCDLAEEAGLASGLDSIGRAIHGLADGPLTDAKGWIPRYVKMARERVILVTGSPKFQVYDTDFGWRRPKKTEVLSIEKTRAIYIGESRYEEGGIEIGMALSKSKMDDFASLFEEGLV